jgi:ribonuclease HII
MPPRPRTALLLGLDEAGYGPFLGPLCVGAAVFRAPLDTDDKPPCLWNALRAAVCRSPKESTPRRPRIAVNDSKALKRHAKPGPEAHAAALADLELGVLAFSSLLDDLPISDDRALFDRLGCACLRDDAASDPRALPLNHDAPVISLRSNALRRAADESQVGLIRYRVGALDAARFNEECERHGSKAAVAAGLALARLRDLWGLLDADPEDDAAPARLAYAFLDRQGGRTDYAAFLHAIDPDARLRVVRESPAQCAYTLADDRRELRILVEVEADSKRFPVALASMAAKYARDLAMLRFNDRFAREFPELKPTQGYGVDGRRWISDAANYLTSDRLRAIVRQR